MPKILFLLLVSPLMAAAASAAEPPAPLIPDRSFALGWAEQHYLNRHRALTRTATELEALTTAFCATPDASGLAALQGKWVATFLAWRRVDGAGAAPSVIARTGRMIDFRPARVRDVESRIARGEGPAPNNVAVRGLGTLEYLLFGDALADQVERLRHPARCTYAAATATLIAADVRELDTGWQQQLERLGGEIDLPRRNLLAENIGLMISGLDGAVARFPKVRDAAREAWPDWRSGTTRAAIGAQLEGFTEAWSGSTEGTQGADTSLAAWMTRQGHAAAAARVDLALERARSAWQALPERLDTPAADAARLGFVDAVTALKAVMERDVAGTLGVVLGFNDNDGD
ncbi:MAG: imelysin family protein [Azoarcus sp.]|nr:imelysin family protein [Azoarcus sp.]